MTAQDRWAATERRIRVEQVAAMPFTRANSREPFFVSPARIVQEIRQHQELLGQLVRRELKVKYKDSALGFLWTLARPLLQLGVYYFAFTIFLGSAIPLFPIFLYSGLIVWNLFTDIVGGSTGSIIGNGGLIKKVWFPREIFPLAVVGAALANFFFQSIILVAALVLAAVLGKNLDFSTDLLYAPPALLVCVMFAAALGIFLAAVTVYLRDVEHLVEVLLLLWFWLTPIVYSVNDAIRGLAEQSPWLAQLYLANPMTTVVVAFQRAFYNEGTDFLYQGEMLWARLGFWLVASAILLYLAQRIFVRLQGNFAQEI
jgi:ABC-2 type transport system permease protein